MSELDMMSLLGKVAGSEAMKKMAELTPLSKSLGLDEKAVDDLIPVVCRYVAAHQAIGKEKEAMDFLVKALDAAMGFAPEMSKMLGIPMPEGSTP